MPHLVPLWGRGADGDAVRRVFGGKLADIGSGDDGRGTQGARLSAGGQFGSRVVVGDRAVIRFAIQRMMIGHGNVRHTNPRNVRGKDVPGPMLGVASTLMRARQRRRLTARPLLFSLALCSSLAAVGLVLSDRAYASMDNSLLAAAETVRQATQSSVDWAPPPKGPPAAREKTIVYLAETLMNGGILAVGEGVSEAAQAIGWTLRVIDAGGTPEGRDKAFRSLEEMQPDGLILGGFNATDDISALERIAARGTAIVGWHAASDPGAIAGTPVRVNIASDPMEVARVAASYAITDSGGAAGVVIFTDSRYAIATAKSDAMAALIRECGDCSLLAVEDIPLDHAHEIVPAKIRSLLRKHGRRWTHSLAINDLYFDAAGPTLAVAGIAPPDGIGNISAGDGSLSAYGRIRSENFQDATVPEPLDLHGWQLVDELNRAFQGQPPSGYSVPVRLIVPETVNQEGGEEGRFIPENGYREFYRSIWRGSAAAGGGTE